MVMYCIMYDDLLIGSLKNQPNPLRFKVNNQPTDSLCPLHQPIMPPPEALKSVHSHIASAQLAYNRVHRPWEQRRHYY